MEIHIGCEYKYRYPQQSTVSCWPLCYRKHNGEFSIYNHGFSRFSVKYVPVTTQVTGLYS